MIFNKITLNGAGFVSVNAVVDLNPVSSGFAVVAIVRVTSQQINVRIFEKTDDAIDVRNGCV